MFETQSLEQTKEEKQRSLRSLRAYHGSLDYLCNNINEKNAMILIKNLVHFYSIHSHAVITPKLLDQLFKALFNVESVSLKTPNSVFQEYFSKVLDAECLLLGIDKEELTRDLNFMR